ncbi:GNAT family N-acetyltransferase [Rheinheimera sp. 4Y26]|uniref:GNAT family N-acetyltransferase n=1 Tax=Rheinheimera sp. 4Y26 TaxID=2977811 RepID=UPI0021B11384|nr:GNAT family N-acetyltransferase [Rheinheimera sp. 4Y26]MCT6700297.1 GNAT family N-acetyltransferase [Rheinheimera sp. 4Y26]
MLFSSPRLLFHLLTQADAALMLRLLNEPTFIANIADRGVRTLEQAEKYLNEGPLAMYRQHGFGMYRVTRKEDGLDIGLCGLVYRDYLGKPDIGYAFFPEFAGQGYASEAAAAVFSYGKNVLQLPEIVGIVAPHNIASQKVLQKLGLQKQGQLQVPGEDKKVDYYALPKV